MRSYLKGGYNVDSLSPFSANHSIMDVEKIENRSQAVDPSSIYELDVLRQLMETLSYELEVPILVGPDRRTVQASVETLKSYNMPDEYDRRPDFRLSI